MTDYSTPFMQQAAQGYLNILSERSVRLGHNTPKPTIADAIQAMKDCRDENNASREQAPIVVASVLETLTQRFPHKAETAR